MLRVSCVAVTGDVGKERLTAPSALWKSPDENRHRADRDKRQAECKTAEEGEASTAAKSAHEGVIFVALAERGNRLEKRGRRDCESGNDESHSAILPDASGGIGTFPVPSRVTRYVGRARLARGVRQQPRRRDRPHRAQT